MVFYHFFLNRAINPFIMMTIEKMIITSVATNPRRGFNAAKVPVNVTLRSAKPERIQAKNSKI